MTMQPYAGFWNRFAALFIDVLVLLIPQALFGYLVGTAFVNRMGYTDPIQNYIGYEIWSRGIALGIAWLYFALLESSKYQATIGKMALGLIVTDLSGNPISFGRASGRFFGKLLSSIIFGFGYIMAGFTSHRQALHDILAKCLVLKKTRQSSPAILTTTVATQIDDEQYYLAAQKEIDTNTMREGIWAKAFAQSPSDENLRRAEYLKLRVAQLRAEAASIITPTVQSVQFKSTAVGKLLHRTDIKVLLVIAAIIGGGIAWDDHRRIAEWMRDVTWTTIVAEYDPWDGIIHEKVHASYMLYGQQRSAQNYERISYRGGTIRFYNKRGNTKPDGVVREARGIAVWKGPPINGTN